MAKSRKWLKSDPTKDNECDPHPSVAAHSLRKR